MMMEGLAYLVEAGCFCFLCHNFNTMWECVWKKKKKKKQGQTTLKKQETGSRKTIFNRESLVLFSKLG
jgi:hypothetical protein